MFKFASFLIVAAAAASAMTTHAETPRFYGNLGYSRLSLGGQNSYNAVSAGSGVTFNKYFGVEADGAFGIGKTDLNDIDVRSKLDYSIGAYLVGTYPVAKNVEMTGRLGYAKTQLSAESMGYKVSNSKSGPTMGIGVRYFPNGGLNGVRADITHYKFDDSDGYIGQIAYIRRF